MQAQTSACGDNGGSTKPTPTPTPEPEPEPEPVAKKTVCDTVYTIVKGGGRVPVYDTTFTVENCQEVAETCAVTYTVVDASATGYTMQAQVNCGNVAAASAMNAGMGMVSAMSFDVNMASTMSAGIDMVGVMSVTSVSVQSDASVLPDELMSEETIGHENTLANIMPVVDCQRVTLRVPREEFNISTGRVEQVYVDVDTLICTVKSEDLSGKVTRCDTTIENVMNVYVHDTIILTMNWATNEMEAVPYTIRDTSYTEFYDIRCYAVDTTFTYDTAVASFTAQMMDTIASADEMRYGGLLSTDTVLEICPRLMQTYEIYGEADVQRLRDSAAYYYGVADSLERQIARDAAAGRYRRPIEVFVAEEEAEDLDPTAPLPDDNPFHNAHYSPSAARARAEAYLKQAERYEIAIDKGQNVRTQEHILDTLHLVLDGETTFGCTILDTFTVSRMPIPYCHVADTGAIFGTEIILWANGHYCDDDTLSISHDPFLSRGESTLQVDLEWLNPFYGNYSNGEVTYAFGDPASLPEDRYNTYSLGANAANPYYMLDTIDGDTLYFPITVTNNDPRDPNACAVTDTVAVTIYRGYHVSGYISYNGLWHPSDKGIIRPEVLAIPDEPVTDADAGNQGIGRHGDHMPIGNVRLDLYEYTTNRWIDSAISDEDGLFTFEKLAPAGRYYIDGRSPQKKVRLGASGISANDASWIQQYAIGAMATPTNPLSMWWYASNVDLSESPILTKGISANDASTVQQVAIGATTQYVRDLVVPIDDWAYSNDTIDILSDTLLHVRGVMRGDANRNYDGAEAGSQLTKASNMRRFDTYGSIEFEDKERIIDYPILSISEGDMLAFQVFMPYDPDQVEFLGLTTPVEGAGLAYNIIDNELLFNWIRMSPVDIHEGDTLAMLRLYLKHKPVNRIDRYFRLNMPGYEVTRGNVHVDEGWKIALPEIALFYYDEENSGRDSLGYTVETVEYTPTGKGVDSEIVLRSQGGEEEHSKILSVIPNPVKTWADITYSVYGDCVVSLKLYTLLGEEVLVIVNSERQTGLYRRNITSLGLAAGVYVLRLETSHGSYMETDVVKVVVQK